MTFEPSLPRGAPIARGAPIDRFVLPLDPVAPRQARDRLASGLAAHGVAGDVADVAVLLASELVTNAVLHGRGEPIVEVRGGDHTLWVGVHDPDSRLPQVQQIDSGALGGRGLHLVSALADAWGAEPIPDDGKVVWFRLGR